MTALQATPPQNITSLLPDFDWSGSVVCLSPEHGSEEPYCWAGFDERTYSIIEVHTLYKAGEGVSEAVGYIAYAYFVEDAPHIHRDSLDGYLLFESSVQAAKEFFEKMPGRPAPSTPWERSLN